MTEDGQTAVKLGPVCAVAESVTSHACALVEDTTAGTVTAIIGICAAGLHLLRRLPDELRDKVMLAIEVTLDEIEKANEKFVEDGDNSVTQELINKDKFDVN